MPLLMTAFIYHPGDGTAFQIRDLCAHSVQCLSTAWAIGQCALS